MAATSIRKRRSSSFRKSSREWSQRDGGSLLNGNRFRLAEQGHNDSKRMKKYFASILVAMMAFVCVPTFTSCGDDDEDDVPGLATESVAFVDPCLDFGSSREHVKDYMSGSSWQLMEESNDYVLMYTDSKSMTTVTYSFIGTNRGLTMAAVTYMTSKAQSITSEIERRYNTTLTKDADATNKAETVYVGQATIGGRTISIVAHCTNATVSIFYKIPD